MMKNLNDRVYAWSKIQALKLETKLKYFYDCDLSCHIEHCSLIVTIPSEVQAHMDGLIWHQVFHYNQLMNALWNNWSILWYLNIDINLHENHIVLRAGLFWLNDLYHLSYKNNMEQDKEECTPNTLTEK